VSIARFHRASLALPLSLCLSFSLSLSLSLFPPLISLLPPFLPRARPRGLLSPTPRAVSLLRAFSLSIFVARLTCGRAFSLCSLRSVCCLAPLPIPSAPALFGLHSISSPFTSRINRRLASAEKRVRGIRDRDANPWHGFRSSFQQRTSEG